MKKAGITNEAKLKQAMGGQLAKREIENKNKFFAWLCGKNFTRKILCIVSGK